LKRTTESGVTQVLTLGEDLEFGLVSPFRRQLAWIETSVHHERRLRMELLQLIPMAVVIGLLAGVNVAGQTRGILPATKRLHMHSGGEP
jgi:hypothetical protein